MDPTRCRADRFSNVLEKSNDVMVRSLFNFEDLRNRKSRSLANLGSVLLWDLAKIRHRLAGEHLNIQPDLELALIRPDFAHLRSGITVDHFGNIKATRMRGKPFCFSTG